MEDYMKIAEQRREDIGKSAAGYLKKNEAHALKLLKIADRNSYDVYVGSPREHVRVRDMTLVDAGSLMELPSLLESELRELVEENNTKTLPEEIHIIQPNWARDIWTVFFKLQRD